MAQQPKPALSSKPKLKRSPLQRNKSTTDPDSIEEQLKASDQMRRMPSVYTTTDFWGPPMASFGPCICSGCRPTLIQRPQMSRYRTTFERCSQPCSYSDHPSYERSRMFGSRLYITLMIGSTTRLGELEPVFFRGSAAEARGVRVSVCLP